MNCKKASKLIYQYNELSGQTFQELDSHLSGCNCCREEFYTFQKSLKLTRETLKFELPPAEFWSQYWPKISRRICPLSLWEKFWQVFKERLDFLMRPMWGPIPVYAVTLFFAFIIISFYPVFFGTEPKIAESNLIMDQSELINSQDEENVTVYTIGSRR